MTIQKNADGSYTLYLATGKKGTPAKALANIVYNPSVNALSVMRAEGRIYAVRLAADVIAEVQ